jgi:LacI family transcriptional regulator
VARVAGVSIRTVSRVLNQSPKVNGETRQRIQDAIAALDFRPSLRARAFAKGRSFLIGLAHHDRNALVLESVQRGVGEEAIRRGYEVICHAVPLDDGRPVDDLLAFCRRSRVDGLVVMPPVSDLADLPARLAAEGTPAVAVSAVPVEGYGAVLVSPERAAAAEVAHHLLAQGHRRIGMITGPQDRMTAIERRAGFLAAFTQAGVTLACEAEGDYSLASGMTAARRLLSGACRPTAIFAANDIMAAAALKVAAEQGIAVPGALSVAGFDGSPLAEMLTPSLTTVVRPLGEMAGVTTRHLIDLIEGEPLTPAADPPLRLRVAQSTAPPAVDHAK